MGPAVRPELALDLGPPSSGGFVPQREAAPGEGRAAKLEEYVRRLEEERRKIEVFRRELPLCMLILNDTIEGVKEELAGCRDGGGGGRPALEEFVPVNAKLEEAEGGVRDEKDFRDKVNWMSSAQLWSDNYSANTSSTTSTTVASSSNSQKKGSERAAEDRSGGGGGGAFLPFKEMAGKEKAAAVALPPPDLSLLSPATKASSSGEHQRSGGSISLTRVSSRGTGMASPAGNEQPPPSHQAAPRKPRRCWSPELHRRFVNALQQLGGAQGSATPKQIRELMKVDGLTNDEVKSHLQKYRLHTRRLPSSSSPEKHPMMVLGGLWAPPENFPLLKQATGSPQGPLHLANAGEDSGEEEDGRSESYSWKGHLQRPAGEETD